MKPFWRPRRPKTATPYPPAVEVRGGGHQRNAAAPPPPRASEVVPPFHVFVEQVEATATPTPPTPLEAEPIRLTFDDLRIHDGHELGAAGNRDATGRNLRRIVCMTCREPVGDGSYVTEADPYPPNDRDLHGNADAAVWAERFVYRVARNPRIAHDEGTMLAWFATAIMAGRYTCTCRPNVHSLDELAPGLVETLLHLGDEYGPLGVVKAAEAVRRLAPVAEVTLTDDALG